MTATEILSKVDLNNYEEPRKTQIYRLLDAASWIAAGERSEAEHVYSQFIIDMDSETPEYTEEIRSYFEKKYGVSLH